MVGGFARVRLVAVLGFLAIAGLSVPASASADTPAPVAAFVPDRSSGPAPLVVDFDNRSRGQIASVRWQLGADSSDAGRAPDVSTAPEPVFAYLSRGTYTVRLTVTGPGGSDTAVRRITAGPTNDPPLAGEVGEFVAYCPFSHRAHHDPIVYPRRPGASHSHDFYGNRSTNASSTLASLARGATNCDPVVDRAAYWAPTLYENGSPVAITGAREATFYYLTSHDRPGRVRAFPRGLKVVAGDSRATSPQRTSVIKWACFNQNRPATSEMVYCGGGANTRLELYVEYPDCWDGRSRDSADHKSHMAYSAGGACPATHPVPVPRLQFKSRYPTQGGHDPRRPRIGDDGPAMTLAAGNAANPGRGSPITAHADFYNAWNQAELERRVRNCLQVMAKCGPNGARL